MDLLKKPLIFDIFSLSFNTNFSKKVLWGADVKILSDITGYIDFLRGKGFSVMLSCFDGYYGSCMPVLLEYEVHRPAVCRYIKSNPRLHDKFIHNKRLLEQKHPNKPYYSHCYAGIEEFVYPIVYYGKTIMCVNVSGYRGQCPRARALAESTAKYCDEHFYGLYAALSSDVPEMSEITAMLRPIEYMVCALYDECASRKTADTRQPQIFTRAIKYIYDNYMNGILCADVAAAVGCSEAYLRGIFRIEAGSSVLEYINGVRLSHAAEILKNSGLSVTETAFASGFSDSNYFSTAFKKKYGEPPKRYRKKFCTH